MRRVGVNHASSHLGPVPGSEIRMIYPLTRSAMEGLNYQVVKLDETRRGQIIPSTSGRVLFLKRALPGRHGSLAAFRNKNLLEQAPPLATHIVGSHRDLAKAYLQVVHSGVLASSDRPVSPRPIKGHTCA